MKQREKRLNLACSSFSPPPPLLVSFSRPCTGLKDEWGSIAEQPGLCSICCKQHEPDLQILPSSYFFCIFYHNNFPILLVKHIIQPETNPQFDIVEIVLVSFFHIILGQDKIGPFSYSSQKVYSKLRC